MMKVTASRTKRLEGLEDSRQKAGAPPLEQPLVSIIINNYNYGHFLPEAIDSALNQIYSSVEVIVVDDGSTDHSREIVASYRDRIIPVLKENGGQASALNAGFAVSSGEIIIFLDADDYLFPHTVERVVAVWKPCVAKVQYRLEVVDENGSSLGFHPPLERRLDSGVVWPILLERGRYGTPVTSGNGFSWKVLDKILPIPEAEFKISADGYLVNLVPFFGQIISIEKALGAYRIHGSNLWALTKEVEVERLHKFVEHDLQKYKLLTFKATELGYPMPQELSWRDHLHLRSRIASLRLNPKTHPVPSDIPFSLVYRGVRAMWQYSELNWQKRLLLSMWFVWVGILPLSMVKPAINRLFVPHRRPTSLDRIENLYKRASIARSFPSRKNVTAWKR